jgi:hypothetical protein
MKETASPIRRVGALKRVAATDMVAAEEVLKIAMYSVVPDDQTQRKAFEALMPYLYVLRNKGCSWEQLTKLLTECGFKLQPSTVRSYFSEMLVTRMEICKARMNEQISVLDAIRKETKGADLSGIANRVMAVVNHQRNIAAPKIDALLEKTNQKTPAAKATTTPPSSTTSNADETGGEQLGEFGLLNIASAEPTSSKTPVFFTLDDAPPAISQAKTQNKSTVEKTVSSTTSAATSTETIKFKCHPLQNGVVPLKRRENVPSEVYEKGVVLEHPAIAGLSLTIDERLYGAALEYVNMADGELRMETLEEKRFRVTWKKPVPLTPTKTGHTFTEMDTTLFAKRKQ